jgi:hypothetical protein
VHSCQSTNVLTNKLELTPEMSAGQIMKHLEVIKKDSGDSNVSQYVGAMTAVHRDTWTDARKYMITKLGPKNK